MHIDFFQTLLLLGGFILTTIGGLALFNDTFRKKWWKDDERKVVLDKILFPGKKDGYYFNRYGRGLGSLLIGIVLLSGFISAFWEPVLMVPGFLLSIWRVVFAAIIVVFIETGRK